MAQISFLRRVRLGTALDNRQITDKDLRESVLEHIRVICSTRLGTVATLPEDFGICDLGELVRNTEATDDVVTKLRNTIAQFEPRLTNVSVTYLRSSDLTLRFEITAELISKEGKSPVCFETTVDAARHLNVR